MRGPSLKFCHTFHVLQQVLNYKLLQLHVYPCVSYCSRHVSKLLENKDGKGSVQCIGLKLHCRLVCFGYLMIPEKWNNSAVRYAR